MRAFVSILVLLFSFVLVPMEAQAQRRTLFDLLFGNQNNQQQAPQQNTQQSQQNSTPQVAQPSRPSASVTVISTPVANKNEDATRLLVMGDTLATDIAKGLEREFAEDPNLIVLSKGVGSSGIVRDDFFDWNAALEAEIAADNFDMAVVVIGINDKQAIGRSQALSDDWKQEYSARLDRMVGQFRDAGKPILWLELPPMRSGSYNQTMIEISALHRRSATGAGVEFVELFDRFADVNGAYTSSGPDINGQIVTTRKDNGIHFSADGADKVAFYISQAMRAYYRGGSVSIEVADPYEGTDVALMVRLPYQGNGQVRLLEVAGAILPLNSTPSRATELMISAPETDFESAFTLSDLVSAPIGRADAFGVGLEPSEEVDLEAAGQDGEIVGPPPQSDA